MLPDFRCPVVRQLAAPIVRVEVETVRAAWELNRSVDPNTTQRRVN